MYEHGRLRTISQDDEVTPEEILADLREHLSQRKSKRQHSALVCLFFLVLCFLFLPNKRSFNQKLRPLVNYQAVLPTKEQPNHHLNRVCPV